MSDADEAIAVRIGDGWETPDSRQGLRGKPTRIEAAGTKPKSPSAASTAATPP